MWFGLGRKLSLFLWKFLPKPEHTAWKHIWELSQPPLQPKTQAYLDFPVIMHWRQVEPLAQNLCTPDDKHSLMAQNGVEVQSGQNALLPITHLENRFPSLPSDTFLTFPPYPSGETLSKLLLTLCLTFLFFKMGVIKAFMPQHYARIKWFPAM